MAEPIQHITARTCPFDPVTGAFQSVVAEAAYREAVRHGITDRLAIQQILQAHNAAEDKSRFEYERWKEEQAAKAESAVEGKYGIITASRKSFHPGEPVFLLRATDGVAGPIIREYAETCRARGCPQEHVQAAIAHAERIEHWQKQNPSLVKKRPD